MDVRVDESGTRISALRIDLFPPAIIISVSDDTAIRDRNGILPDGSGINICNPAASDHCICRDPMHRRIDHMGQLLPVRSLRLFSSTR